jgi:hypothetical protein
VKEGEGVLRTTVRACVLIAGAAFLLLGLSGHLDAGLALGIGLVIGSANGYLARHTLGLELSFWASSIGRLAVLSAAGLGVALLLDPGSAWLVPMGIGAAQVVMAGVAVREALRA